jgi:hypothetical protein
MQNAHYVGMAGSASNQSRQAAESASCSQRQPFPLYGHAVPSGQAIGLAVDTGGVFTDLVIPDSAAGRVMRAKAGTPCAAWTVMAQASSCPPVWHSAAGS